MGVPSLKVRSGYPLNTLTKGEGDIASIPHAAIACLYTENGP